MKISVIADKPVPKTPKHGYVYRHRTRGGNWLGVSHPQIAQNRVILVNMQTFENWWASSDNGGFGISDPSDFEEVGKLTVEK